MLRYALLSLLDETPMSGYDLAKLAGSTVGFCWPASHSQIYPELKKLGKEGLIEGDEIAQEGRPNKTIHGVTDAGREALAEWARSPIAMTGHRDPTTLRVFAIGHTDPATAQSILGEHLADHRERLSLYELVADREYGGNLRPDQWSSTVGPALALDAGIRFEKTWIEWLEDLVDLCSQVEPAPSVHTA